VKIFLQLPPRKLTISTKKNKRSKFMCVHPYNIPRDSLRIPSNIKTKVIKMYDGPKMEKLTINLPPVEIARIDALVESGLYPSRTEFIRSSVRKTLDSHEELINKQFRKFEIDEDDRAEGDIVKLGGIGIIRISREQLEKALKKGKKCQIRVAGLLVITNDVPPGLIKRGVESIKVYGSIKASKSVKEELKKLQA
jgi:Arc/MetJ-type ribon-helix-helix transcriptional regulator